MKLRLFLSLKKYAGILYAYQRASNLVGTNIPSLQILQTNDFIMPASDPFDESPENLYKRAIQNDPHALITLSMKSVEEPLGLEYQNLSHLSLGSDSLLELLFLNDAELVKSRVDWEAFETYQDVY